MENSGPASPKLGDRDLARPGAVDFVEYPSYHLQQGGDDVMMMEIVMMIVIRDCDGDDGYGARCLNVRVISYPVIYPRNYRTSDQRIFAIAT